MDERCYPMMCLHLMEPLVGTKECHQIPQILVQGYNSTLKFSLQTLTGTQPLSS